jgi:hypothetical protein
MNGSLWLFVLVGVAIGLVWTYDEQGHRRRRVRSAASAAATAWVEDSEPRTRLWQRDPYMGHTIPNPLLLPGIEGGLRAGYRADVLRRDNPQVLWRPDRPCRPANLAVSPTPVVDGWGPLYWGGGE